MPLTLVVLAAVAAFLPVSDDAYRDSVTLNGMTYSYAVCTVAEARHR